MTVDNSISCVQQDSRVSWGQQIIELLGHNRGIIFAYIPRKVFILEKDSCVGGNL